MGADEKTRLEERLAEAFHDAFRKEVLAPPWAQVAEGWRFGVLAGVRAVIESINKENK